VVVLYALTNPQHTPWMTVSRVLFHDVPCRNCLKSICPQQHHDCLAKVEPADVAAAALAMVAQRRTRPAALAQTPVKNAIPWLAGAHA
jgi:ADP-heptose:LPS heptosyltransferase